FTIRGQGMLQNENEIGDVVVRTAPDGTSVLVKHIADVHVGAALRYGVITHNGEGEAVTGIVMMLLGSNSRDVVLGVRARLEDIKSELPPGVKIEVVYDRGDFVDRTLSTVTHNLVEGVLIVTVVLALFLGTLRGALVVALGIPGAMAIALLGMHLFGITGDLMSLGAIDFGFLVDGPIVILEGIMAVTTGRELVGRARAREYEKLASAVATPVAYAVTIIMLVYIPLLTLEGVEGKMFRPMALTMACALFGALVYSVLFFPADRMLKTPAERRVVEAPDNWMYQPAHEFGVDGETWNGSIDNLLVWLAWIGEGELEQLLEFVNTRLFAEDMKVLRAPRRQELATYVSTPAGDHPLGGLSHGERALLQLYLRSVA
ncbi:efflux RND transporter permease subunit, partial [bacterium]